MPYRTCHAHGLFVLRWEVQPQGADVTRLLPELDAALAAQPVPAFLTLIPAETQIPTAEARDLMSQEVSPRATRFARDALVIEGTGLSAETKRLFTRAMLSLVRIKSPVFASVEEALGGDWKPPELDAAGALAELRRQGFLR